MPPSSSNAPQSCGSGIGMEEVTRPLCYPGTGLMPQLLVTVLWREPVTLRDTDQWEGNSRGGAGASPAACQG